MKRVLWALAALLPVAFAPPAQAQFTRTYTGPTTIVQGTGGTPYNSMAVDRSPSSPNFGDLFVCDTAAKKVKIYEPSGSGLWTDTGRTIACSTGNTPLDIAFGSDNTIWLLDNAGMSVESAPDPTTASPASVGTKRITLSNGSYLTPLSIAVSGSINNATVYVSWQSAQNVQAYKITSPTVVTAIAWSKAIGYNVYGITVDATNSLCVPIPTATLGNTMISRYDSSGNALANLAPRPTWTANPTLPDLDFVVDASYPGGGYFVYGSRFGTVAPYSQVVYRFAADGTYLDGYGPAQTGAPNYSVATVRASGNFIGAYVTSDSSGNIINRSSDGANGFITQMAATAAPYTNPNPSMATGDVVISQVFGGGGASGAKYDHDFIELYNKSANTVDLSGFSVQYASATGNSWSKTNLTGTIAPHQHYLIQELNANASNLPTPDAKGSIDLSTTVGKVALYSNQFVSLSTTPNTAGLQDFVGYGTTVNAYEGAGAAPAPSATTSIARSCDGIDTNSNSADFITGTPAARNSAWTLAFTSLPTNQHVNSGQSGTFTAATNGFGVAYQWYAGTPPTGTLIPSATGPSYTTSQAGKYFVIATDGCSTLISNGVALRINPAVSSVVLTPSVARLGQSFSISATVVPGTDPVDTVTADVSSVNTISPITLTYNSGSGTYEGTSFVLSGTSAGAKTITVTASANGLSATGTATLNVINPTQLAFTTQPVGARAPFTFKTQPVVAVQDPSGNTVTLYNGPVSIALKPGTGTSGAALSGTTTVTAVNGVATFTDLALDKVGTGYQLTAAAIGLTVDSAPFDVLGAAPGPWGDVDQDGFVTLADAQLVQDYIDGKTQPDSLKERIRRYGDVNGVHNNTTVGNGVVDVNDALRVARIAGGILDPGTAGVVYPSYGDINGDGKVNLADAVLMLRYIQGVVSDPAVKTRIETKGIGDVSPTMQSITFGDGAIDAADVQLITDRAMGKETTPFAYTDYWPMIPNDQYTFTDVNHRSGDALNQIRFNTQSPAETDGYTITEVVGDDGSLAGVFKGINGSIYAKYVQFPVAFSNRRLDFQSPIKVLDASSLTPGQSWKGNALGTLDTFGLRPILYKVTVMKKGDVYDKAAGNFETPSAGTTVHSAWSDTVSVRIDVAVLAGVTSTIEMQQAIFFDFAPGIGVVGRSQAPLQGATAPATDRPNLMADEIKTRGTTYNQTTPAP